MSAPPGLDPPHRPPGVFMCNDCFMVARLNRCPAAYLDALAASADLLQCHIELLNAGYHSILGSKARLFVEPHLVVPILTHIRDHGAVLKSVNAKDKRIFLDDLRHWHVILTAKYLPSFMDVLRSMPEHQRIVVSKRAVCKLPDTKVVEKFSNWHCVSPVDINKYDAVNRHDPYGGTDFKFDWLSAFQSYTGAFSW